MQQSLWTQPANELGQGLGPDLFPGDDVIWRGVVFGDAPREFLPLRLAEQQWLWLGGDGVPDRLDESQAILSRERRSMPKDLTVACISRPPERMNHTQNTKPEARCQHRRRQRG